MFGDIIESGFGSGLGLKHTTDFVNELGFNDTKYSTRPRSVKIIPDEIFESNQNIQTEIQRTGKSVINFTDHIMGREVFICKKTFAKIFLESYQYIYRQSERVKVTRENKDEVLIATYGLMFTTPSDTTALRLNSECLSYSSIKGIYQMYLIISGFLASNYDKTNKSSCLHLYFKKLHVMLIDRLRGHDNILDLFGSNDIDQLFKFAVKTCISSIKEHPKNYYACNSLRFFMANAYLVPGVDHKSLIDSIHANVTADMMDSSIWDAYCDIVVDMKIRQLDEYRIEWNRYARCKMNSSKPTTEKVKEWFTNVYNFAKYTGAYGPLLMIFRVNTAYGFKPKLLNEFYDGFRNFELKHDMQINVKRECLIDSNGYDVDLNQDLILREEFKKVLNMKRIYGISERLRICDKKVVDF